MLPSDYKAPSINLPADITTANNNSQLDNLSNFAWWREFNDSQLNKLIDSALINNNDIDLATKNIAIAQAQLNQIELLWIPGINLFAGFSQNPAFGNPGVFFGLQPTYITNLFTTYYAQKQAKYDLQLAYITRSGVKLIVISQITASYFSLLTWQANLKVLHQQEADYKQLVAIAVAVKKLGLSNNIQISALKSKLYQVTGKIQVAEQNIVDSENAIRYLINQPPGIVAVNNQLNQINSNIFVFRKINIKTIAQRPDVMYAFKKLESAGVGINLSASKLLPSLNFGYFTGQASLNGTFANPNNAAAFADAYTQLNVAPSTFGSINVGRKVFQREVINYNKVIQNALREVSNGIDANEKLSLKYIADKQALEAMIDHYNLQQDKYNQGIVNKISLLNTQIQVNELELALNTSKLEQLVSIILLYQQLAGGYNYKI